jgi:hypothetical protein
LQPTALMREAWLKLVHERSPSFADRTHFIRAAAMRSVLVDHLHARRTLTRGRDASHVEIDSITDIYDKRAVDLLVLDEALQRLAQMDLRLAQVVE